MSHQHWFSRALFQPEVLETVAQILLLTSMVLFVAAVCSFISELRSDQKEKERLLEPEPSDE